MLRSSGFVLVDKARGPTSHDVVDQLRKILSVRRIGHAGTLDPMATGLLVMGVGSATRLLPYAQSGIKTYSGTLQLGVATDTLDAEGEPVASAPVPPLTSQQVRDVAQRFVGSILQAAPMVSARRHQGRRLHQLAREGQVVERESRPIEIYSIQLDATGDPMAWNFVVRCSPGTYVRVLASDLAVALGTVGHLSSLRRESSGGHRVEDARSIEDLALVVAEGGDIVQPAGDLVTEMARVRLSDEQVNDLSHGRPLNISVGQGTEVLCLDRANELVGIAQQRSGRWWPHIVLSSRDQ